MKLFLDTNILIDYFTRRQPYFDELIGLRAMQLFGDVELWVSAKSFTDVFYVARKVIDKHALQAAFADSLAFFKVCSVGQDVICSATQARWDDFEDCLVACCASRVKADYLITRDKEGFEHSPVAVMDPTGFLTHYATHCDTYYTQIGHKIS
jgi:predicted nucleic acid-binding protein